MTDLNALFAEMEQRFDAGEASSMDETFQYDIEDAGSWNVIIKDGACSVSEGEHDDPSVTLGMNAETFVGVLNGDVDGMQAFMTGDIKASGDIMLATRLTAIFPKA